MRFAVGVVGLSISSSMLSPQNTDSRAAIAASSRMAWLEGTWRLAETRQRISDGTSRPDPDLGPRPAGYLMFDAGTGQMCAVVNNGDRVKWGDATRPTDAEAQAIWQ